MARNQENTSYRNANDPRTILDRVIMMDIFADFSVSTVLTSLLGSGVTAWLVVRGLSGHLADRWLARYKSDLDKEFDVLLAEYDVLGSLAHTEMLAAAGLLSREDLELIHKELNNILGESQCWSTGGVSW